MRRLLGFSRPSLVALLALSLLAAAHHLPASAAVRTAYYTRAQSDARYYTRGQSDGRYAASGSAYPRAQSDGRYLGRGEAGHFAPTGSSYTKGESDGRYTAAGEAYPRGESDGRYMPAGAAYSRGDIDGAFGRVIDLIGRAQADARAALGCCYSKSESDARYAPAGSSYTKADSDARYAPAGSSYTKDESDARYAEAGSSYTTDESDARYGALDDQPRVFAKRDTSSARVAVTNVASVDVATVTVSAPADGCLLLQAAVDLDNDTEANKLLGLLLLRDGAPVSGAEWSSQFAANGSNPAEHQSLSGSTVIDVTGGTTTVALRVAPSSGTASFSYNGESLIATWHPAAMCSLG